MSVLALIITSEGIPEPPSSHNPCIQSMRAYLYTGGIFNNIHCMGIKLFHKRFHNKIPGTGNSPADYYPVRIEQVRNYRDSAPEVATRVGENIYSGLIAACCQLKSGERFISPFCLFTRPPIDTPTPRMDFRCTPSLDVISFIISFICSIMDSELWFLRVALNTFALIMPLTVPRATVIFSVVIIITLKSAFTNSSPGHIISCMANRANDWFKQAQNDLLWAEDTLKAGLFAQVCFIAQQIAEKCLKAYALFLEYDQIRSHSIFQICKALKINGELENMGKNWIYTI